MILLVALALATVIVAAANHGFGELASIRVRLGWLIALGLFVQVLVINWIPEVVPHGVAVAAHVGSYVLVGVALYANRRLPWLWLVATGGFMNFAAIVANGGMMPASPAAMRAAGFEPATAQFTNSGHVESIRLFWLGDVFATPAGWPLANVFSIGDVVLVVGTALMLHTAARRRTGGATGDVTGSDELQERSRRTAIRTQIAPRELV